jgi:hypothetical protein
MDFMNSMFSYSVGAAQEGAKQTQKGAKQTKK